VTPASAPNALSKDANATVVQRIPAVKLHVMVARTVLQAVNPANAL